MKIERDVAYRFAAPRAKVWLALADTARFNEAIRLPAHEITQRAAANGQREFRGHAKLAGFDIAWTELPVNWVKERWMEHDRLIDRGPLSRFKVALALEEDGQGCVAHYKFLLEPRGVSGRLLLASGFLNRLERTFLAMSARAERFAADQAIDPFDLPPPKLDGRAIDRIERLRGELVEAGHPAAVVAELARLVGKGGENDVRRIRPLRLARMHGFDRRATVAACLDAARRGLFDLSWDLLCPRCRGAKSQVSRLDQLPTEAHCDSCAIRYDRDFSQNVELTFHPAPGLRAAVSGEFCLLGPMSTPHILAHITLPPGLRRGVDLELVPGSYRIRGLEPGPELALEHEGGAVPSVAMQDAEIVLGDPSPPGTVDLVNETRSAVTFVLEERAWLKDALTADRVSANQDFRDLFSDQVLRPGDEVGIARVAVLFSDLSASTALYQQIGEAAAFQRVREHFAWLQQIIRHHDGAIVKTIGDAVMAAFADPLNAVRAAIDIQMRTAEMNPEGEPPLALKIGVHAGPSIAVTLNERLDYFGSTANLAARLQGLAGPGDVVVSESIGEDPAIRELVAPITTEHASVKVRGFDEPVAFLRLVPKAAGTV